MSQDKIEVVKRFEHLMTEHESTEHPTGDYAEVLETLDPHVVVRVAASLPHGGEWVGHDGFIEMSNAVVGARRVTEPPEFTYLDGGGDYVIVLISFSHEVLNTGDKDSMRMVEVFTVRDGKITSLDPYYDDTVPFAIESGVVAATPTAT